MPRSAVLLRFTLSTVPLSAGAISRVFQIQRTSLLNMHFLRSVLPRQTSIRCKPSIAKFSSSSTNLPSDAHLLTITDERDQNNMRIGDDDEGRESTRFSKYSKQEGGSSESCRTVHEDDSASGSYETASIRQEEDEEFRHKQKQRQGWQGERFSLFKSRGQHLLTNPRVLDSIIRKAKILPTDTVLEIGPGTGNLTIRLLECAKKVIAIEIDERMVETLCSRVAELGLEGKLIVITGNVLKMELPHFDICVSNIPYGISSPLIAKIFLRSYNSCFRSAVILLQKEFARRLLAKPGESDYCRLAVNVKLVASADFLMNVSKNNFVPSPKVDSTLVQIQPKLEMPDIDLEEWLCFTRICFSKKNKTLCAIFKKKKKLFYLYEKSLSKGINCNKILKHEDQASDYDIDGNSESDDGDVGTNNLVLEGQNSTEILRFKEKIVRILLDGGFCEKRSSKLSNKELLFLLDSFNKEGVFFH